jgi:hypothetical protein
MTNDQGPKSQSSSNDQCPITKKEVTDHSIFFWDFGHWELGFDRDLAPWSLGVGAVANRRHNL